MDQLLNLSIEDKIELIQLLEAQAKWKKRRFRDKFFTDNGPTARSLYPKHTDFMAAGSEYKIRLFMAGNRVGKSFAAAYELACHLTGEYPHWWQGKRFKGANSWWVCGVDSKSILSTLQPLLLGQVGDFGAGMIPYNNLVFETLKDAKRADTPISKFRVRHASGGYSTAEFKSYESGRESFQSFEGSIWLDEEAPLSIFTECLMRTATGDNIVMMTFTPLKGISETIMNFLEGRQFAQGPIGLGKYVVMAGWDDVPHLSAETKSILLASIPPYQRDARSKGLPSLGAGAIYPVPESDYVVDRFDIPKSWPRMFGFDVGWNKTAAIWIAKDPDTKVHYIYHEYYKGEAEPSIHVVGLKSPGAWIPAVIDTAARGRSQIDGNSLMSMYKDLGLTLFDADKSVETGIYKVWEMLSTGQLKAFRNLNNFMDEIRMYRRDEKGKIIKSNDHLLDSLRYAIMGLNHLTTELSTKPTPYQYGIVDNRYRVQPIVRR